MAGELAIVDQQAREILGPAAAGIDVVILWLANQREVGTQRVYAGEMKIFLRFIGVPVLEIRQEHIIAYRHAMRGWTPATVARKLSTLRSFYSWACDSGRLDADPTHGVKLPRVASSTERQALPIGEAQRMLTVVDRGTERGRRDYAALALMFVNALRIGEVVAVRWGDFHEREGYQCLTVRGKGSKNRLAVILPQVMRAIRSHKGHRRWNTQTLVFPVTTRAIAYRVKRYAAEAGIERVVSPHVLRHTSITAMLAQGAHLARVQAVAGHADPKTTMRYTHLDFLKDNPVEYNPIRV